VQRDRQDLGINKRNIENKNMFNETLVLHMFVVQTIFASTTCRLYQPSCMSNIDAFNISGQ